MRRGTSRSYLAGQLMLAVALFVLVFVPVLWLTSLLSDDAGHNFFHEERNTLQFSIIAVGAIAGIAVAATAFSIARSRNRAVRLAGRLTAELEAVARELARKNESLEKRVQERTAEITQKAQEVIQSRAALLNVLEDLTTAKKALEAAQAYDQALLQSIADGVVAVDRRGRITTFNAAAEGIMRVPASEVLGKELTEVIPKVDENGIRVSREERVHLRAISLTAVAELRDDQHYYVRPDGTKFPVAIVAAPILVEGRTIGAITTFRDITEQRHVEQTKDEFVSLASHELRTPLTGIGWYAELLTDEKSGKLTPTQREYLHEIIESNRRMSALVDSLLNVSRLELGTFAIQPESVDIRELTRDVLRGFVVPIEQKELNIKEEFDPSIGRALLDPRLMTIIIQNLISNAVKYTSKGGTITIRTRIDRSSLIFEVIDTGIGIPLEEQDHVFRKLFRADNARLQDPEGSGLGLYMVQTLLGYVDGDISFVSAPQKGTTFTVHLPRTGMVPKEGQQTLLIGNGRS